MTRRTTIYLEEDLDQQLRQSAERDGRSVTKQIDHLLRSALSSGPRPVIHAPPTKRDVQPDPKIKGPRRRSRT